MLLLRMQSFYVHLLVMRFLTDCVGSSTVRIAKEWERNNYGVEGPRDHLNSSDKSTTDNDLIPVNNHSCIIVL